MGLDNGIEVRVINTKNKILNRALMKSGFYVYKYIPEQPIYEAVYWRKCWNLREDVIEILRENHDCSYDAIDQNSFEIDRDDLICIKRMIAKYLKEDSEDYWDRYDFGSIWTWKEYKGTLKRHYKNIGKLIRIMDLLSNKGDLKVVFYDSY